MKSVTNAEASETALDILDHKIIVVLQENAPLKQF